MKREEIIEKLKTTYEQYTHYVKELTEDEFEFASPGKWSAGQQTEHLIRSTKPLLNAFRLPKFVLKSKFGKANRPSRSYEELVERYKEKLDRGAKAMSPYIPGNVSAKVQTKVSAELGGIIEKMSREIEKWSEEQLDEYILPHPLLGKITIREMLYFTIYHAMHHQMLIKLYLKGV